MKKEIHLLKALITFGVLLLLVFAMLIAYIKFKPQTVQGSKKIMVEVVVPDEESKEFSITTVEEYLGPALEDENLVKGSEGEYGLFITEVNGFAADDSKQEWWCITKGGGDVFTGADSTPIVDGDHFEITLITGY